MTFHRIEGGDRKASFLPCRRIARKGCAIDEARDEMHGNPACLPKLTQVESKFNSTTNPGLRMGETLTLDSQEEPLDIYPMLVSPPVA